MYALWIYSSINGVEDFLCPISAPGGLRKKSGGGYKKVSGKNMSGKKMSGGKKASGGKKVRSGKIRRY